MGGTSSNVTRLSIFTAAMSVCDPSLEGHASRVGVACRSSGAPARLDRRRARGSAARRRAPRCRQGERSPRRSPQAGAARRQRARRGARAPSRGRLADRGDPVAVSCASVVLFHHERWDGCGYPTRRAGLEIPIEGRLLAVADSFDAMTSSRPYCDARAFDGAIAEVERCSGSPVRSGDLGRIHGRVHGGRDRRREPLSIAV